MLFGWYALQQAMTVTVSTMKCPLCEDQYLETLSSPVGDWQRCPSCEGFFIRQDLVAKLSADSVKCTEALEETKSLLLPTERWCPKCLQKLFDGRVRSRGVIFSLCVTCQSLWTNLSTLRQFEEIIEKTLRSQSAIAVATGASESASRSVPYPHTLYEDSGLGGFFRSVARFSDYWADRFSKAPRVPTDKKSILVKPAPQKTVKKSVIVEVEPGPPSPPPPKMAPAPATLPAEQEPPPVIEIPEFIFPEVPVPEEPAAPEPPVPEKPSVPEEIIPPAPVHEPVRIEVAKQPPLKPLPFKPAPAAPKAPFKTINVPHPN